MCVCPMCDPRSVARISFGVDRNGIREHHRRASGSTVRRDPSRRDRARPRLARDACGPADRAAYGLCGSRRGRRGSRRRTPMSGCSAGRVSCAGTGIWPICSRSCGTPGSAPDAARAFRRSPTPVRRSSSCRDSLTRSATRSRSLPCYEALRGLGQPLREAVVAVDVIGFVLPGRGAGARHRAGQDRESAQPRSRADRHRASSRQRRSEGQWRSPAKPSARALREQAELVERAASPRRHREQTGEDRHRVDRLASLLVPVVVVQVKPQRELVERQRRWRPRRADAVTREPHSAHGSGRSPPVGPEVADPEQPEDPERAVVDVAAAIADVVKRTDAGPDRVGDPARGRERGR